MKVKTIGIAGGGQLGRMLTDAAHGLGYKVVVLDPTPNSPTGQVADEQIIGDYKDATMMKALAEKSDVLTYEIESVNADALAEIAAEKKPVHPTPKTLNIIKDKLQQKSFLAQRGIPTADFVEVANESSGMLAGEFLGFPFVLKARYGGFDGRGNATVKNATDIWTAATQLGTRLYAEKYVPFQKELAVIAARTVSGEMSVFPLVETIHKDHICHMTITPATVSDVARENAYAQARRVLKSFEGAGVFAVEMFLVGEEVLVNEVAPRVHNSGHWTIEGCETSQFEQHVRAISGMPLGGVKMKAPVAVMINILGDRNAPADPQGIMKAEKIKGVKVHIYGKIETRMQRKMGHLTAVAETLEEAKANAEKARALISI